ncbi:MAG: hypothetical protein ACK5U7_07625 [Bacteroidota bacterium]
MTSTMTWTTILTSAFRSCPVRIDPSVWLSHPTWYVVPSEVKDSAGDDGGTVQVRITCKKAAHQTDPPEIQDCRRSRWMGGVIVSIDLSQIELRVAALLSGEPFFVNAYTNGWDMHGRAAALIWSESEILSRYPDLRGLPVDRWRKSNPRFSKFEGQVGKRINFSHLFRAGADKMQASVLADIHELLPIHYFEKIVANRQRDLPVLWAWQEARIAEARSTGRVTLPVTGHHRNFAGGEKYDVNEIVNFPIQSSAAMTLARIQHHVQLRLIQHNLDRAIKLFLNVYDALYFDCASPHLVPTLLDHYREAVRTVTDTDYWAMLQAHYGRKIPLDYEHKAA